MFGSVKASFEIEKIPDSKEFKRIVFEKDKKGALVRKEVTEKGGYMAYFPQGHSLRIRNDAHLKELNLTAKNAYNIDMESGIVMPARSVGGPENRTLKEHVARVTKETRGSIESDIEKSLEGDA